jgi:uncharacterized protein YxjI
MREKLLSIGDDYWIEDEDGNRAYKVDGKALRLRKTIVIDVEGGDDLKAKGNIVDHEYEIERDGDTIARISKRWFRMRETYGVEIDAGEDEALLLAAVVAIETLTD